MRKIVFISLIIINMLAITSCVDLYYSKVRVDIGELPGSTMAVRTLIGVPATEDNLESEGYHLLQGLLDGLFNSLEADHLFIIYPYELWDKEEKRFSLSKIESIIENERLPGPYAYIIVKYDLMHKTGKTKKYLNKDSKNWDHLFLSVYTKIIDSITNEQIIEASGELELGEKSHLSEEGEMQKNFYSSGEVFVKEVLFYKLRPFLYRFKGSYLLGMKYNHDLLIEEVEPYSKAERFGFKAYDKIIRINSENLENSCHANRQIVKAKLMIKNKRFNEKVIFRVKRKNEFVDIDLTPKREKSINPKAILNEYNRIEALKVYNIPDS